jgi:CRISPR-associated protein Cmr6
MTRQLAELVAQTSSGGIGRIAAGDRAAELPAHAGLWLDRIVARASTNGSENGSKGHPERERLYELAVQALQPVGEAGQPPAVVAYRHLFECWRRRLERDEPGLARRSATVEARSRLLLHPATGETVTEGSVLLHHTYGVPYLPGSGLKGLVRRRLEKTYGSELAKSVLGSGGDKDALAAAVDVLDALWMPEPPAGAASTWSPLALDVVTPHHPEYYTAPAGGRLPPTDYDEPNPVQRLTVAPGARFLVVLEAPGVEGAGAWLESLLENVLLPALDEDGFGAWTSAGYGRLRSTAGPPARDRAGKTSGQPAPIEAHQAIVRYEAGNGELRTVLPDQRVATASRADAEGLLASLPATAVERLRSSKRQARLLVEVEPLGRAWKISSLRPVDEPES